MSENTNNENDMLATLSEGEVVIPKEYVEKNKEAIEELVEKYKDAVKEQAVKDEANVDINAGVKKGTNPNPGIIYLEDQPSKPGLGFVNGGAMGSTQVPATKKAKSEPKESKKEDTVAIHSTRNVTWSGVGKVYRGYNIVTKDASKKWLTRDHTRLATPEEVAQEFGL